MLSVSNDVADYLDLRSIIDLGLQVHHSEISFEKILVFSWIKEELVNGREHRV